MAALPLYIIDSQIHRKLPQERSRVIQITRGRSSPDMKAAEGGEGGGNVKQIPWTTNII